jgi:hypothetical protein
MPIPKMIITYDEEGNEYKRFMSVKETASYFNKTKQLIYNYTSRNNYFAPVEVEGKKFSLRFIQAKREVKKDKELEDDIRRKWQLNPYGDWRNDEWIYAMVDRVNAELEKDKSKYYDPLNKAYERNKKREDGVYVNPGMDTRGMEF